MRGGMSSAVHLLTVGTARGSVQAVLRRYVRPEVNEEEPDIARQEAEVLRFVEPLDVPTPRLLAVDPAGDEAGVPALLMSRLPGRVDWWPTDADRWLRGLAEILPPSTPAPSRPYPEPSGPSLPTSSAATNRLRGRATRPCGKRRSRSSTDRRQTNLLSSSSATFTPATCCGATARSPGWSTGRPPASVRPPSTSPTAGPTSSATAATSPSVSRRVGTGERRQVSPLGRVVTVIGFLDDLREDWGSERLLVEDMLAHRAVAELGGSAGDPRSA